MKFLVFDTVGLSMQVALYIDGTIYTACEKSFRRTSERLMPSIDELLKKGDVTLNDLDFISCVVGPGSFTGIRIGVSTARAFAQFSGKKVVGVTYSSVMAYNSSGKENIVTLSDASNSLCYVGVYDAEHNQIAEPSVIAFDKIEEYIDSLDFSFEVVSDSIIANFLAGTRKILLKIDDCSDLVRASLDQYNKYGATDYNQIVPLYIRISQAEADLIAKESK